MPKIIDVAELDLFELDLGECDLAEIEQQVQRNSAQEGSL